MTFKPLKTYKVTMRGLKIEELKALQFVTAEMWIKAEVTEE